MNKVGERLEVATLSRMACMVSVGKVFSLDFTACDRDELKKFTSKFPEELTMIVNTLRDPS